MYAMVMCIKIATIPTTNYWLSSGFRCKYSQETMQIKMDEWNSYGLPQRLLSIDLIWGQFPRAAKQRIFFAKRYKTDYQPKCIHFVLKFGW